MARKERPTKDVVIRYMDSAGEYYLAYAASYQPVFRYAFNQWKTVEAAREAVKEYNGRPNGDYHLRLVANETDKLRALVGSNPPAF